MTLKEIVLTVGLALGTIGAGGCSPLGAGLVAGYVVHESAETQRNKELAEAIRNSHHCDKCVPVWSYRIQNGRVVEKRIVRYEHRD